MARVVAGLDGFKSRWVGIVLRDGVFDSAAVFDSLAQASRELVEASVIAVDTPIGFPLVYGRRAEQEAKILVGGRRSSVFLTLPKEVYSAPTFGEASEAARRLTSKGLSQQSYGLRRKMLEALEVSQRDSRFIEVHPEVSFRELAGSPIVHSKTTWTGLILRQELLRRAGIIVPFDLPASSVASEGGGLAPGAAAPDDIVDAAIAAWTADRHARGKSRRLPAEPMEVPTEGVIWY
jgi:predicted RNase H-like nuclease